MTKATVYDLRLPILVLIALLGNAGMKAEAGGVAEGAITLLDLDARQQQTSEALPTAESGDIEDLLRDRSAEYDRLMKEAQTKGIVGGALRGAILGGLITTDVTGVVGGALLGGAFGAYTSDRVATQLILEHRNYTMRRWSLQQVIEAAKTDSENTHFDLMLTKRYFTERASDSNAGASPGSADLIGSFRTRALERMIALHEILPLHDKDTAEFGQLEIELHKQQQMIADLTRLIEKMQ